jgi:hypothetical protein
MKVLSPGMQHRQKTDSGAEMPWVGGDLQQGFGGGTEEKAIDLNNRLCMHIKAFLGCMGGTL